MNLYASRYYKADFGGQVKTKHQDRSQRREPAPMRISIENEKVFDLTRWKHEEFFRKMKKMAKNVNDLVLIPAALIALMAL